MKLLTLNTHSLSPDFPDGEREFLDFLLSEQPDGIALQEVNQTASERLWSGAIPMGYVASGGSVPIRRDNFAARLARGLSEKHIDYHWCWFPVKCGYSRFDEGLAIFTRARPIRVRGDLLSGDRPYDDPRRRMALSVRLTDGTVICCTHTSRWDDPDEPFAPQWERLMRWLPRERGVFLMGDLNNPAERRGEGYDLILRSGFTDGYTASHVKRGRATVTGALDGWRDGAGDALRIDYIFLGQPMAVMEYRTVLDGVRSPRVSDHLGVMLTVAPDRVGGGR